MPFTTSKNPAPLSPKGRLGIATLSNSLALFSAQANNKSPGGGLNNLAPAAERINEEDWTAFKKHMKDNKGQVVTNAAVRLEAAKFLRDKREADAARQQQGKDREEDTNANKAVFSKLSSKLQSVRRGVSPKPFRREPVVKQVIVPEPPLVQAPVTSRRSKETSSSNKHPDQIKKKSRRKMFQALLEEKLPDYMAMKNSSSRKQIDMTSRFVDSQGSIGTDGTSVATHADSMGNISEKHFPSPDEMLKKNSEFDDNFVDGLLFFAPSSENAIKEMVHQKPGANAA